MKTTKAMIEVMTAYDNGAEVEYRGLGTEEYWNIDHNPNWDWGVFDYRIKEQKKTITIEKWLVKFNDDEHRVIESSDIAKSNCTKVRLLDTYEVEL